MTLGQTVKEMVSSDSAGGGSHARVQVWGTHATIPPSPASLHPSLLPLPITSPQRGDRYLNALGWALLPGGSHSTPLSCRKTRRNKGGK